MLITWGRVSSLIAGNPAIQTCNLSISHKDTTYALVTSAQMLENNKTNQGVNTYVYANYKDKTVSYFTKYKGGMHNCFEWITIGF